MLITFSGLDGSGKSTLIGILKEYLEKPGARVRVLTMYDHIGLYACLRRIRDQIKSVLRRPGSTVDVEVEYSNDKDRELPLPQRSRFLQAFVDVLRSSGVKRFVYVLDLVSFLFYRFYVEKVCNNILVMDRYFYDSLADVSNGKSWGFVRCFLFFTPEPDVPVWIDTPPEESFARKGEYSVPYLVMRREKYAHIFGWVKKGVVIKNDNLDEAKSKLIKTVSQRLGVDE